MREIINSIRKVLEMYWDSEETHYQECEQPEKHIFRTLTYLDKIISDKNSWLSFLANKKQKYLQKGIEYLYNQNNLIMTEHFKDYFKINYNSPTIINLHINAKWKLLSISYDSHSKKWIGEIFDGTRSLQNIKLEDIFGK